MTPTSSFRAVFRGGKTWAQIEAEPEPNRAGHLLPLDYSSTRSLVGLDNPRLLVYDRFDPSKAHGIFIEPEALQHAEGFVGTDVASIVVAPTDLEPGQYFKSTNQRTVIRRFPNPNDAPGNKGGFHALVIDTEKPGTDWLLLARFIDVGPLYQGQPELGCRPHAAMLVRPDVLLNTKANEEGMHKETTGLTKVGGVVLPSTSGKVLITCACQDWTGGTQEGRRDRAPRGDEASEVMTCAGDGFYPVMVGRDKDGKVCKITVLFMGKPQDYHHGIIATATT